jgi:hypothetical protein
MTHRTWLPAAVLVALGALTGAGVRADAQHVHSPAVAPPTTAAPVPGAVVSRRVSEAELHANEGVPRGWRFGVEPGDAARGREMFAELECYKCHAVAGEKFPVSSDGQDVGPELTGMGRMHPAEYIAESILFPNHVIVDEPGHTGPDGRSKMPSYADSLTVTQWLDLVAYLKGLTEGGEHPIGHAVERVTTAGEYRIRVVYAGPEDHGGAGTPAPQGAPAASGGHGMQGAPAASGGHAHPGAPVAHPGPRKGAAHPTGRLMAFITDRETGEAVPYLPVSVTVTAAQAPGARRALTLRPMVSDRGFHYGADATLPEPTHKLTLVIGATTMRVTPSAKGRFAKPVTAVVDWRPARQ